MQYHSPLLMLYRPGKFVTDRIANSLALAIRFTKSEQDDFVRLTNKVNEEMFLRYARPAPRFRKIVLRSVGDDEELAEGIVDLSRKSVFLPVECQPIDDVMGSRLKAEHEWIVMLSLYNRGELSEIYRFTIDKTSECITTRDLIML